MTVTAVATPDPDDRPIKVVIDDRLLAVLRKGWDKDRLDALINPPSPTPCVEPRAGSATAEPSQQPTIGPTLPNDNSSAADVLLLIYADALDDLERVRIATENRVRSLRQVKGMDGTPEETRLGGLVDGLRALEHGAELELKRALRTHPLGPWVKRTVGVGEKQGARLLAAIGDPASRRTVSQLWAYCGYHVLPLDHSARGAQKRSVEGNPSDLSQNPYEPQRHGAEIGRPDQNLNDDHPLVVGTDPSVVGQTIIETQSAHVDDSSSDTAHAVPDTQNSRGGVAPARARGQKANWNATAKMRAFLIAQSCVKQRTSPYRAVYDAGRLKYADSLHPAPCRRCGPAGKPALVGSPLSDGHKHARALRLVAKAILRDLWVEAKEVAAQ